MSRAGVALVVGVTGVAGAPFAEQLLCRGWRVYGTSRRAPTLKPGTPLELFVHLPVDLRDAGAIREALLTCGDVETVFYCANSGSEDDRQAMLDNLLNALEASAPRFRNLNILQGMKYYGCHLGPFKTPAREDDPRIPNNAFYYREEDLIRSRQVGRTWNWTALRPHSICGYSAGNPKNLAVVLAVYATLRRQEGTTFPFPGNEACFRSLFQVVDAELLTRAAIHVSTHPACANDDYNINNGDIFRWETIWPALGAFFGLQPGGPSGVPLSEFLSARKHVWEDMAARHDLRPLPYTDLCQWVRGDYSPPNSRLACEYDLFADTVKLRQTGFSEVVPSDTMFQRLFERFIAQRIIPPI